VKAARTSNLLCFGNFEVGLRAGDVRKQGVKLRLPEPSFQILAMLLEHPGELAKRGDSEETLAR
jgi:DNA-binding response OmpR family regulator